MFYYLTWRQFTMQKISEVNLSTYNFVVFSMNANYMVQLLNLLDLQEYGPGFESPESP